MRVFAELDWYVSSYGLQHHIAGAWRKPLTNDTEVCQWLVHRSTAVRNSTARAVSLKEVDDLAQVYMQQEEGGRASLVYKTLLDAFSLDRKQHLRVCTSCLAALDSIKGSKSELHVLVEARVASLIFMATTLGTPEWLQAFDRLKRLHDSGAKLVPGIMSTISWVLAFVSLGMSTLKTRPTAADMVQGGIYMRQACQQVRNLLLRLDFS